jgi:hypothetical protein
MDAVNFSLGSVATIVNAFCDARVLDKALLGRLASILQQMDAKVRFAQEACGHCHDKHTNTHTHTHTHTHTRTRKIRENIPQHCFSCDRA